MKINKVTTNISRIMKKLNDIYVLTRNSSHNRKIYNLYVIYSLMLFGNTDVKLCSPGEKTGTCSCKYSFIYRI